MLRRRIVKPALKVKKRQIERYRAPPSAQLHPGMINTKPLPNSSNNGSTHQRIYQLSNGGRGLHLLQPTLLARGFYSVWATPYLLRGQVTRDNYETCVFTTALDYFLVILCILLLKLLEVLKKNKK